MGNLVRGVTVVCFQSTPACSPTNLVGPTSWPTTTTCMAMGVRKFGMLFVAELLRTVVKGMREQGKVKNL